MNEQNNDRAKVDLVQDTKTILAAYKSFFQRHQTTILAGAVVFLFVNQRGLAKDLNLVATSTLKTADASIGLIDIVNDHCEKLDILRGYAVQHANAINAQAAVIEELQKSNVNIMDQFFGAAKKK